MRHAEPQGEPLGAELLPDELPFRDGRGRLAAVGHTARDVLLVDHGRNPLGPELEGPALMFEPAAWSSFVAGVQAGDFAA
ncbi:DUF397 domain-containing protein [Streptomyces sioyaensis]|uniref:DUF397 domain-containing protein n=1 Tax=Streptomyces sioyaensis TaxID=67364 RepID=UPI0037B279D3